MRHLEYPPLLPSMNNSNHNSSSNSMTKKSSLPNMYFQQSSSSSSSPQQQQKHLKLNYNKHIPSSSSAVSSSLPSFSVLDYVTDRRNARRISRFLDIASPVCQVLMVLVIVAMMLEADSRSNAITSKFQELKDNESRMLFSLQRIEHHSMQVHENLRSRVYVSNSSEDEQQDQEHQDNTGSNSLTSIDKALTSLQGMTQELHSEVKPMQRQIAKESTRNLINTYGEGPIKVELELEFSHEEQQEQEEESYNKYNTDNMESSSNPSLVILLWPDTPHAAWTWLEQIERQIWDGSAFEWSSSPASSATDSSILSLTPTKHNPKGQESLQFLERHYSTKTKLHAAWTVGLRTAFVEDDNNGQQQQRPQSQMFINLQDNSERLAHETCIGRIVDGFDALQRLLETIRHHSRSPEDLKSAVRVKNVSAMHLSSRELAM